jgi:hypothetical protein
VRVRVRASLLVAPEDAPLLEHRQRAIQTFSDAAMGARNFHRGNRFKLFRCCPAAFGFEFERVATALVDATTSGTPALTPRPFMIAASIGLR